MGVGVAKFLASLVVAIIEMLIGDYKRDKGQQQAGEIAAENAILEKAAERAQDAHQVNQDVAKLPATDVFNKLRGD